MGTRDLKLGLESGSELGADVQYDLENVKVSGGYRGNAVMRLSNADTNFQITNGNKRGNSGKSKKPKKNDIDDSEIDE